MSTIAIRSFHFAERRHAKTVAWLAAVGLAWLTTIIVGAQSGFFATLKPPEIGGLIITTIILPIVWYLRSPSLQALFDAVGQRWLLVFHIWRIPAALLFFWFGARGELPPPFWLLAGGGDFFAGLLALFAARRPATMRRYLTAHLFGLADLIVATGAGMFYAASGDPRMALVSALPLALIPLYGVGITITAHVIALAMFRRGLGVPAEPAS